MTEELERPDVLHLDCSTCIHSCVAMSAAPCDRCNGFTLHEPRPAERNHADEPQMYGFFRMSEVGDIVTVRFEPPFEFPPPPWLLPPRTITFEGDPE